MVFCTNHGNPYHYYEMYQLCKKENLKFGFGVEAYWVKNRFEKDNTNNHIIILAKNEKGRKAINLILSEANENGFYYKPRVDIELIMSLPENDVVITTSCLGFYGYENWEEYIELFHSKFKDNFYIEIQCHLTEKQIELNKKLLSISKKSNIKMIAGLDSHYIYEEQKIDRDLFLYSKGIVYEEENGWFMDYPDYETIKIPTMYPNKTQEEKDNILKDIIRQELKLKFKGNSIPKEYSDEIKKEWNVIKETKMSDYFILNYHIIKRGIELGGNITLSSRGSSPSYYLCNVLGFTTIDMLKSPIQLYPERFATIDRIKAGSLFDIDFNVSNRPAFMQAQKEILGENNSYFFSAYGKLKEKSCWKMFAKANDIPFEVSNEITKYIDKYEKAKKYAETDEEREEINIEDFIPKEYMEIYNGSKKYNGVIDSISPAPCGFLLSQYNIKEEIGIVRVKDELCANIDGITADKALMMKNDLLIVTVVDIIYETYKKIGINPHTSNELIELTKNDEKVWNIFSSGNTVEINQCTNEKSKKRLSVYKPKNIAEISAFVAAIRPSFKSMVDIFLNRKDFNYGISEFDNLLKTEEIPQSMLLYQEQLMKTLNYAGFDISECYQIIKAIAKKKQGVVEPLKERFLEEFTKKIMESENN